MTGANAGYKGAFTASSSVGGTKVRVAELQEITWKDSHAPFDATSHDSNGARERIGGITDLEAGVDGLFRDDDASQVALFDALTTREAIDVQLAPAGSSGVNAWGQTGFVSRWSIGGPVDGPARFSSSIVGTGGASQLFPVIVALDTFTDSDGNLSGHTPDLGFGGWTYSGAANEWEIDTNRANKPDTDTGPHFCRSDNDLVDDELEMYGDYTRNAVDDGAERHGLYVLASGTTAIANGEGVLVEFRRSGGGRMDLLIVRRDAAGVEQQSTNTGGITIATGTSLRIGLTVSGLVVTAWTEPSGGGTRTTRGTLTLGVDLRDGDHQRAGLTGRAGLFTGSFMDNLTFIRNR